MTQDERLLQKLKAIKANPRAVLQTFNQMQHKTVQAYTLAIKAHIDLNALYLALELWRTMEEDPNVKLNTMAYNKLLHIYHEMHEYNKLSEVYNLIVQNHRPNIETFHRLIMAATAPEVDSVEQVRGLESQMYMWSNLPY